MTTSSRPIKFRLHFNRIAMQRRQPEVWTVHTSKACIPAQKVSLCCPNCGTEVLATEYKGPDAPQPRAFQVGRGRITAKNGVVTVR